MHTMHKTPDEKSDGGGALHYHAVVWLDHHEAKVIHFNMTASEEEIVRPADPPPHLHIKAGSASGTHVRAEPAFYRDIATAVGAAQAILIVGPSTAKAEFVNHLRKQSPRIAAHIAGVEAVARLTEHQLLAEGRRFFAAADRMTPQMM